MALSADQLAQLRKMIDEEDDSGGWSDIALEALAESKLNADGTYDLRSVAAAVWETKAASTWTLVQTSESGSSRAMQQKFEHAIVMAKTFGTDGSGDGDDSAIPPRSTKIVRPTREG